MAQSNETTVMRERQRRQTVVRCRICFGVMGNLADNPELGQLAPVDQVHEECPA